MDLPPHILGMINDFSGRYVAKAWAQSGANTAR